MRGQNPPPVDPPVDLFQLVLLGLMNLGLGRGKSRNNPKASKQAKQTTKQTANCKAKQTAKQSKTTGVAKETAPKHKCTICKGQHSNLIFCSKLTQHLPLGNNQLQPPVSLCVKCLSTKHWNAQKCNHMDNKYYKQQICKTTKRHFLMCTACETHLPAIRYMSQHHNPNLGWKNLSAMRNLFGVDMFQAMIARDSPALNQ